MNFGRGDTVLAARWLIGAKLVGSDGKEIGHIIDLEVDPRRDLRITGVELGRFGWVDRLRAFRPLAHDRLSRPPRVVAWAEIDVLEDGRLYAKPGARVRQLPPDEEDQGPPRTEAGG